MLARGEPDVTVGTLQQFAAFGERIEGLTVAGDLGILRFVQRQRQFARGAGQVLLQDVVVRGVGDGVLDIAPEKLLRILRTSPFRQLLNGAVSVQ